MPRTVALDYRKLPSYKSLFLDYLHRFQVLSPFFSADPSEPDAWQSTAETLMGRNHPGPTVASQLDRSNRAMGADEVARRSIESLSEGALAIVTGQQVGLFGGPLYTLYKALTAVVLARRAEALLARPVVPLFWMDADDHDFDEVRHAYVLGRSRELVELHYDASVADRRLPMAQHTLEPSVEEPLHTVSEALAPSEFQEELLRVLRECYTPGRRMADAFGSWLLHLTRGTGLAMVDPSVPELKGLAVDLFQREVAERSESSERVRATTRELASLGYHAQATPTDSQLNLFYANPERYPVALSDSGFRLANDGDVLSKEEVQRRIREKPQCFSPNVLLRPLYQDTILPTLAYVAGPNELAYFAQLREVYRHFEITMPLVVSRASFTVVERPQARFLERYQVELSKLNSDDESLLNEILRRHTPPQLDEDLQRARACIKDITEALGRDLADVDQTLLPTVKSTRGKLLHQLEELESKALRAVKRKNDTIRQQFLTTRTALFPGFEMQERKISAVSFLNKYGWHFSKLLEQAVDPSVKAHQLFYP